MINFNCVNNYCSEDLSLIENYEQAVNDKTQIWDCHHRLQIELRLSKAELIKQGLYWNRPPSELIFLTHVEHARLHHKGKYVPAEARANMSAAQKGKNHGMPKAVYQIDKKTGEIIKKWNCISDVTRALGIFQSNITNCCKGRIKSTGGFKWKYAV